MFAMTTVAPVIVSRLIPVLRTIAESGVGILLIEQFAPIALGLSNRAYVMEGGRIQYEGRATELQEKPELLHSAYLLRGGQNGSATVNQSLPAGG